MAEMDTSAVVDNEGMANDYFSLYEPVNEDGSSRSDDSPTPAPQQPAQGNEPQAAPQGAQPPQNQGSAPAQPQGQPAPEQGFYGRFFKQDEQGNQVFDAEAAHGLLFNPNGPNFSYQGQFAQSQQPAQQQQPGQQPAQPNSQEEVPPWKQPLVERQNYEKQQAEQLLYGINQMRQQLGEALNQDPATAQFLAHQERLVREHIRDELIPKWEYERQAEQRKTEYEQQQQRERLTEYKSKAQANIGAMASQMGGEDAFNQFFFGQTVQGQDGKQQFVKGPATDALYHVFDLQNPDAKGLQGEQLQEKMNNWWHEFSANQNNLAFLYKMGVSELREKYWPKLVDKVGATKEAELRGQQRARMPDPSTLQGVPQGNQQQMDAGLKRYLQGPETI